MAVLDGDLRFSISGQPNVHPVTREDTPDTPHSNQSYARSYIRQLLVNRLQDELTVYEVDITCEWNVT